MLLLLVYLHIPNQDLILSCITLNIIMPTQPKLPSLSRGSIFPTLYSKSLSDLELKLVYDRVTVRAKVSKLSEPTEIPTGKKKQQDIIVVNGSGSGVFFGRTKLEV